MKTVCVYCGSSSAVAEEYKEAARAMGAILAREGVTLVYGGGHVGLMGILADSVLHAGGQVTGIIPDFITRKEIQHKNLTELHVVDNMHERKMMMAERSDGFIVLPGGFGTLDEFFEILTWRQLQLHDKPIVLVNSGGYWSPLLEVIDRIVGEGFASPAHRNLFTVAGDITDVMPLLRKFDTFKSEEKWDKI